MTTLMNITSSFIVVIFASYILVFIYTVVIHQLYIQHTLIHIHVYKSQSDHLNSLLDKLQKDLEKRKAEHVESGEQTVISDKPVLPRQKKNSPSKVEYRKKAAIKPKSKDISVLPDIDLMKWKRPKFLSEYRNPCWYYDDPHYKKTSCRHGVFGQVQIKPTNNKILRCLPYFYIIGQPRSGLTNIYNRVIHHPDIIAPPHKDIFWIQKHRFFPGCSTVSTYLDYFHGVSEKIQSNSITNKQSNSAYHSKITGDCSGDILWDNTRWFELPGNKNCNEPCLSNADYIKHLNPTAKIIISFRDPTERLYSDYLAQSVWLKYKPDNEEFHRLVNEMIYSFNQCLNYNNTIRTCIYSPTLQNAYSKVRLEIGLYHIYLEDWLKVFPRNQIHVMNFEYFKEHTSKEISRLYRFLGLRQLNQEEMAVVMDNIQINRRTKQAEDGDMWQNTRDTLQSFYKPYNEVLSNLLKDKKFLWNS